MRADRLLSILLLLQVHQRMTARELAARLEVSQRTILRDMDALSTAGVPVSAERGAGGGWSLREAYRTNLTGLNATETQALFLTQPVRLLNDLGLRRASEAALIKLLAALPAMSRRGAEYARQRIHVDPIGWNYADEPVPVLPVLQEAVWQERRLQLGYRRDDGRVVRLVDPLGLVAKGSVWYLVAGVGGEVRTYRVSRIQDATLMEETFVRPDGFDLAAHWAQSSAQFKAAIPRYPVVLRLAEANLPSIQRSGRGGRIEHVGPIDASSRVTLRLRFDSEEEAAGYILSFGTRVEVLEPVELRERLVVLASSIVSLYCYNAPASLIEG